MSHKLAPETITDQRELALVRLFRERLAERVCRPNKGEFIFFMDGLLFDSRLIVKDELPKLDLRERRDK